MTIEISFEGAPIEARRGESLLASLTAAGQLALRETATGEPRGAYCGMGVCQECLVEIDGVPNQRACMVKVIEPMRVRRARDPIELDVAEAGRAPRRLDDLPLLAPDILVIGAGPAGLAAAIAARGEGAAVMVVDERAAPGGQYYKQLAVARAEGGGAPADRQHREGAELIGRAMAAGIDLRCATTIWGAFPGPEYAATGANGTIRIRPRCTVIATGAHERGWSIPGWTLPGVMTTGAAQTLWRTARRLPGKRVLIAGNGPLNIQLAAELTAGGCKVVGLIEAADRPGWRQLRGLAGMMRHSPRLVAEGMGYLARLSAAGVPMINASIVTGIEAVAEGLIATIDGACRRTIEADIVCLGYGLRPSNELARSLGMDFHYDAAKGHLTPVRSAAGESSIPGVFVVGDGASTGGAHVAMAEGTLAGLSAARRLSGGGADAEPGPSERQLARHRAFQRALWQVYAPSSSIARSDEPDAILCRCESVRVADVTAAITAGYATPAAVKQRTRLGMGRCQGRYCAPELERLLGQPQSDASSGFAPRAPARPIAIGDLAR